MEILGFVLIKSSGKALNTAFFLIFWLNFLSAQCLDRRGEKYYSEPSFLPESSSFKNSIRRISLSIASGILTGFICSFLFALLVMHFVRYIHRKLILKIPVVFSPKISPRTLKLALANEPQFLGSSSSGKYYKAVLDNGLTVAVKRLDPFEDHSSSMVIMRKVQQELEMLAGLRHRNLMSLRSYVCEPGGYFLIYDYMPNGSLEDVMKRVRENQLDLKWEFRLRIAVGISKGLHYLHFIGEPRRLHYNLKPSNIILDSEFEPRLGDYGLMTSIVPSFRRAASGYVAPECSQNFRYTDKSDVFSFGVILGVLLTGRDPLDPFFSGRSMGQWLRYLQQAGETHEALDKSIVGDEVEEHEMLMAVRIAVVCLSDLPADRPSSDELVIMLTQLNGF